MQFLHAPVTATNPQAIDRQDHDGADHRHDEPDRLSGLIHAEGSADPAAEHGADDAENDGHDHAPGVTARHDELGNDADDQSEYDPQKDIHAALSGPIQRSARTLRDARSTDEGLDSSANIQ